MEPVYGNTENTGITLGCDCLFGANKIPGHRYSPNTGVWESSLLDGLVMLRTGQFVYHEMIAHVPLIPSPRPGFGYRRVRVQFARLKRSSWTIDLVEIDEWSLRNARSISLREPGLSPGNIHVTDGIEFVRKLASTMCYHRLVIRWTRRGAVCGIFTRCFRHSRKRPDGGKSESFPARA
jgi:hypothetical protein